MKNWIEEFRVGEIDGHPLAQTPHHDDDCERWDWHVKIGDKWHEVDSCSLRFDADSVVAAIKRIKEGQP
jgi:hypothetical protein